MTTTDEIKKMEEDGDENKKDAAERQQELEDLKKEHEKDLEAQREQLEKDRVANKDALDQNEEELHTLNS
jgi:predicted  nucleic acid-binding Zn-ribbon protein